MSDAPKVSVAVTTYRHEDYVERALRSVLDQQTGFPVEIVVTDDASPDGTAAVVQALADAEPGRIHLVVHEVNAGANASFVETVARCRGEYVALLDGDDYWTSPHKLAAQADHLDRHPDCSIVFTPAEVIDEDGRSYTWRPPSGGPRYGLDDLLEGNFVATSSTMFRHPGRPEFPDWFDEARGMPGDWTFFCLLARSGHLDCLPEPMSVYRIHRGGMWSSARSARVRRLRATVETSRHLADDLGPRHAPAARRGLRTLRTKLALERTLPFATEPLLAARRRLQEVSARVRR